MGPAARLRLYQESHRRRSGWSARRVPRLPPRHWPAAGAPGHRGRV